MADHVHRRITDLEKENIRLARESADDKRAIEELEGNYGIMRNALEVKRNEIWLLKQRAEAASALVRESGEHRRTIKEWEGKYGAINDALEAKESEVRVLKEQAEKASASNEQLARENEEYKLRIGIQELRDSVREMSDSYAQLKKRVEKAKCEEATSAMGKVSVDMKAALQKMSEGVAVVSEKEEVVGIHKMREVMNCDYDATIWTAFGAGFLAAFAFVGMTWCSKQ